MRRRLLLFASAAALASCGEENSSVPEITEPPAEAVASGQPAPTAPSVAEWAITEEQARRTLATLAAPYNAADLANGRSNFTGCQACHTLTEGGPRLTGPNLWGLFGRRAGSEEGFAYSPALREANFIWDAAKLELWLDNPKEFLPGNKMIFPGIHDAKDRRDLIAYIATQTRPPSGP